MALYDIAWHYMAWHDNYMTIKWHCMRLQALVLANVRRAAAAKDPTRVPCPKCGEGPTTVLLYIGPLNEFEFGWL